MHTLIFQAYCLKLTKFLKNYKICSTLYAFGELGLIILLSKWMLGLIVGPEAQLRNDINQKIVIAHMKCKNRKTGPIRFITCKLGTGVGPKCLSLVMCLGWRFLRVVVQRVHITLLVNMLCSTEKDVAVDLIRSSIMPLHALCLHDRQYSSLSELALFTHTVYKLVSMCRSWLYLLWSSPFHAGPVPVHSSLISTVNTLVK